MFQESGNRGENVCHLDTEIVVAHRLSNVRMVFYVFRDDGLGSLPETFGNDAKIIHISDRFRRNFYDSAAGRGEHEIRQRRAVTTDNKRGFGENPDLIAKGHLSRHDDLEIV